MSAGSAFLSVRVYRGRSRGREGDLPVRLTEVAAVAKRASEDRRRPRSGRWLPLRAYLGGFLGLFAVTAVATMLLRRQVDDDAMQAAVALGGMLVLLIGALLLYRAMTTPLLQLSDAMAGATTHLEHDDISPSGPAEVARLALRFNALLGAVQAEIGERRQAETAARVSERNYRLLFDGNPQPLMVYDIDTLAFLEVNAAAISTYGYTRDEFLSLTVADLVVPDQAPLLAMVKTNPDLHRWGPWKNRVKDGSLIDVDITSIRLTYDHHHARLVVVEEFTERKRLANELSQSQRLETVGRLAGGIAHDFNNLLAVILNYAEFVAEELPEGNLRDDVGEIQRAAVRAADLTRQLLTFARRQVVNPQVLDLNDVVHGLDNMLRHMIGENVTLVLTLADDLPCVRADPGQIEQIVLNLTLNARDAMTGGGRLEITTAPVALDDRAVADDGEATPGPQVRLSVQDTGVGMSPDVVARAFEPFFTTKPAGLGTGLGLATVYGIVAQAGGRAHIDSTPGAGTRVNVDLPVVDEPATPIERPPAGGAIRGGEGRTVLLVEDETAVLLTAARILSGNGYRVRMRTDADDALIVLADPASQVDVLVTDLVMPGLSGVELGRRARLLRPGLPILFMSGYAPDMDPPGEVLPAAGLTLRKPFSRSRLLEMVGGSITDGVPDA